MYSWRICDRLRQAYLQLLIYPPINSFAHLFLLWVCSRGDQAHGKWQKWRIQFCAFQLIPADRCFIASGETWNYQNPPQVWVNMQRYKMNQRINENLIWCVNTKPKQFTQLNKASGRRQNLHSMNLHISWWSIRQRFHSVFYRRHARIRLINVPLISLNWAALWRVRKPI